MANVTWGAKEVLKVTPKAGELGDPLVACGYGCDKGKGVGLKGDKE